MTREELTELRELFRREFQEHDFCIGEEQVERVFRILLSESEPIRERPIDYNDHKPKMTADEISKLYSDSVVKNIKNIFERDDTFYREMKKK